MFFKVVISLLLLSQALLEENRHVFFYFYFFMRGYTFQEMCVCFFQSGNDVSFWRKFTNVYRSCVFHCKNILLKLVSSRENFVYMYFSLELTFYYQVKFLNWLVYFLCTYVANVSFKFQQFSCIRDFFPDYFEIWRVNVVEEFFIWQRLN